MSYGIGGLSFVPADLVRRVKKLAGGRLHVAAQVSDTSAARVTEIEILSSLM